MSIEHNNTNQEQTIASGKVVEDKPKETTLYIGTTYPNYSSFKLNTPSEKVINNSASKTYTAKELELEHQQECDTQEKKREKAQKDKELKKKRDQYRQDSIVLFIGALIDFILWYFFNLHFGIIAIILITYLALRYTKKLDVLYEICKKSYVIFDLFSNKLPIGSKKLTWLHYMANTILFIGVFGGTVFYLQNYQTSPTINMAFFLSVSLLLYFLSQFHNLDTLFSSIFTKKNVLNKNFKQVLIASATALIAEIALLDYPLFSVIYPCALSFLGYKLLNRHWSAILFSVLVIGISATQVDYIDWSTKAHNSQHFFKKMGRLTYRQIMIEKFVHSKKNNRRSFPVHFDKEFIERKPFVLSYYHIGNANALNYTVHIRYELHLDKLNAIYHCRKRISEEEKYLTQCTDNPFSYIPYFNSEKPVSIYSYHTAKAYVDYLLKEKVIAFMKDTHAEIGQSIPMINHENWFLAHYPHLLESSILEDKHLSSLLKITGDSLKVSFSKAKIVTTGVALSNYAE